MKTMKKALYLHITLAAIRAIAAIAAVAAVAAVAALPLMLASPGAAAAETDSAVVPSLVRVTSSFEAKHASAVLRQVAKLFSSGFIRKDAERLAKEIDSLPAEQSKLWDFSGVRKGATYRLQVRARLDEFGMLDLDFFAAPEMVASVRSAVDGYLNARGL
jgi:hypothetical protein